ncbi:MAG: peptidoglycan DD-metalloendopeptidase family protein [Saprospiraceae bacterium]|nr:peptidoglycan DD-metalloendopeptidase family protein [Saprospiraceae bacterium]
MKKHSFSIAPTCCLLLLVQLFFSLNLLAQQDHHHEHEAGDYGCSHSAHISKVDFDTPPSWGEIESSTSADNAPNIDVVFDQQEGNALLYETVAGWTGSQAGKAQVSLKIWAKNNGSVNLNWNKVIFEYVQSGQTKIKIFTFTMDPIAPNAWKAWQNGRDYHEVGDVLYLDAPLPNSLKVKLYFSGFPDPVVFTKTLAPYTKTFGMPFRAFDLASNEVWQGGSTHGGGSQVFAYDLSVQGLVNGVWSYNLPGTNGTENAHSRVWGKPIYAMADGTVKSFNNSVPNNPKPGEEANWQNYTNGGGGNHFYIQHGENIALYAHMQKGTLNAALLQVGKAVKAGDFLGYAGNSGSSSGPHLHIHIRKETTIESGPFRPLLFNTGFAIQKTSFTSLSSSADWKALTAHGLPGYAGTRAFIWPSGSKPNYGTNVYNGVFRAGTGTHAMWVGASAAAIVAQDNTYKGNGMRMIDLSVTKVGSSVQYSGVWRAGTGVSKLQTGTTWAAFTAEWNTLSGQGYRLLDVEVYTDGSGNIRYAGIYGAGNWGHHLVAGMTQAAFNTKWAELGGLGFRLVDVEVYKIGGVLYYAGVFKSGGGGYALWHANDWNSFTTKWSELHAQGYRLVDLDTDGTGNNTVYSGTFLAGTDGYALYQNNWNAFYSYWSHVSDRGLRLTDLNIRAASGPGFNPIEGEDEQLDDDFINEEVLLVGPALSDRSEQTVETVDLRVFPNPVSDQFSISAEADILGWNLHSALGTIVQRGELEAATQNTVVQVNELPSGVYYLIVQTAKGSVKRKVEVVR